VQRLNKHSRNSYAAEKLWRDKLKQSENGPKNIGLRPKHMRYKTYHKVAGLIMSHESKSHEAFMAYFAKVQAGFAAELQESNI